MCTSKNNNRFRSSCLIYSRRLYEISYIIKYDFKLAIPNPPPVPYYVKKPRSEFPSTGIGLKSSACNKLLKSINLSSLKTFQYQFLLFHHNTTVHCRIIMKNKRLTVTFLCTSTCTVITFS